ncbi:MAG: hydrolase, partial [Streptomycetales bacterium]
MPHSSDRRVERLIATPAGEARALVDAAGAGTTGRATLVLGHGAGGGADAADLLALAGRLPDAGISVVRVE